MVEEVRLEGVDAMLRYGAELSSELGGGGVLALVGGLGAGKTHLVKGLAKGLGYEGEVTSPTFTLVHEYASGSQPIFHFDFYRLETEDEAVGLGWDEYLEEDGIVVVEWADRYPQLFPPETIWLSIDAPEDEQVEVRRVRQLEEGPSSS